MKGLWPKDKELEVSVAGEVSVRIRKRGYSVRARTFNKKTRR